jgi:hypothetical protein
METPIDQQLSELRAFFDKTTLPKTILLAPGSTINDVPSFIKTQFNIIESNTVLAIRRPPFDRLVRLKELLSQ